MNGGNYFWTRIDAENADFFFFDQRKSALVRVQ